MFSVRFRKRPGQSDLPANSAEPAREVLLCPLLAHMWARTLCAYTFSK